MSVPAKALDKKTPVWLGEYRNNKDFKMKVVTQSFLEKYADEIIQKAYNDDNFFTVEDLYLFFGIPKATYYDWIKKFPFFREAHDYAKLIIGRRREKHGIMREWNTLGSMAQYNDRWKESDEWKASLKEKQENKESGIKVVLVEKFEDPSAKKNKEEALIKPKLFFAKENK